MRILLIVNKVAPHAVETRHATKDLGNKLGRQAGWQAAAAPLGHEMQRVQNVVQRQALLLSKVIERIQANLRLA